MDDLTDDELLAELGVEIERKPDSAHSAKEERIIAGFEDIVRFREEHGRAPMHGEGRDIFERLYAVRLDRLRALPEVLTLLAPMDPHNLLDASPANAEPEEQALSDDALLSQLAGDPADDITLLRHVTSRAERNAPNEIANHAPCTDFDRFRPRFERADADLKTRRRETRPFGKNAAITEGDFFILAGQMVLVAEVGEPIRAPNGETDARLRVIYANGTESNLLRRSLQRALYKDGAGRRLTEPSAGPLFGAEAADDDLESGTIYVLRSQSDHPEIAARRDLIHKIGVTGGSVETRVAAATTDATFLLAGVTVVATYKLFNLSRARFEAVIHRVFAAAQLDLTIADRFGRPVQPREWFLVPLHVIDEAIERIRDGSITGMAYDPEAARLVAAG